MLCHHYVMDDKAKKLKLDQIKDEINARKIQLREIRLSYDLAKDRLTRVERQLKVLDEHYDLLANGQLPLNYNDESVEI